MRLITDINHPDYFSNENMEALENFTATNPAEAARYGLSPAQYSDWEHGPGENADNVRIKSRPVGDNSFIPWQDNENTTKQNEG